MVYLPECVKQINLKRVSNCSDYLNKTLLGSNRKIAYEIKISWEFNLETGLNNYTITGGNVSEIGYMLLYSFNTTGGRISIDTSAMIFPDFNLTSGYVTGYLNRSNLNYRFAVLLKIEPVQKMFYLNLKKAYNYPGIYFIRPTIFGYANNPSKIQILVSDGNLILLIVIFLFCFC
jgi:hypothetical protein